MKKKYYAKMKKCTVSLPVLDEKGKAVYVVDNAGNVKRKPDGTPLPMMKNLIFPTVSNNQKLGFLSTYETDNKIEQQFLDEKVEDPSSPIMSEDMYKSGVNKDAYEFEKELKEARAREGDLLKNIEASDLEIEALRLLLPKDAQKDVEKVKKELEKKRIEAAKAAQ